MLNNYTDKSTKTYKSLKQDIPRRDLGPQQTLITLTIVAQQSSVAHQTRTVEARNALFIIILSPVKVLA